MTEWQPLWVREGRRDRPGPVDGLPSAWHLLIGEWFGAAVGIHRPEREGGVEKSLVLRMMALCDVIVPGVQPYTDGYDLYLALRNACEHDEDLYLEVIDALLHELPRHGARLESELKALGSAWMVLPGGSSLTRRISKHAQSAFDRATSFQGASANYLTLAWDAAFGRNHSAKTAWANAIQAVEAVYIPLVVPNKEKANLGSVAGQLNGDTTWTSVLIPNGTLSGVKLVEEMIRTLWPEPERHPQDDTIPDRSPTLEEAQALVVLAVTLVEWARQGVLTKPL